MFDERSQNGAKLTNGVGITPSLMSWRVKTPSWKA